MHTKIQYQAGLTLGSNFSDFSLDTDLGRMERLGHKGLNTQLLTKFVWEEPPSIFHDDWANNMTSRVFLVKTDRPSGSHNDGLSKFHENKANHVTARVKTAPAHGDHAFKQTKNLPEISFKQIICPMLTRETNLPLAAIKYVLSKFQSALKSPKLGGNQPTDQPTNRPTNQPTDQPTNRQGKNNMSPTTIYKLLSPGSHVFEQTRNIFIFIIKTNFLTKFHEAYDEKCLTNVFQPIRIVIDLVQGIIGTYLLTKLHEDRTVNVASREKCPAPCGYVFRATGTFFKLVQDIIGTNLLTKFHDDRTINVASRVGKNMAPPCGHVFQPSKTIYKLVHDIIDSNILTEFHDDRTINVASRVLTRKNYSTPLWSSPPCGHVFQPTETISKLVQDIIDINIQTEKKYSAPLRPYILGTNLFIKFHKDRTIHLASRV
ncbi:hypothetical protein DPMN_019265 [Dreissena polymorpha]|uniref:Uncharacterized protein n=1 Tax=Dreissena polymorpha TaxID=45954 RepID=A0A9D4NIX1_DREPO|nr:hypothetical protein DPMN_019265 [Dreissena polymorpha]